MEMDNSLAINEATLDREEVPLGAKVDYVDVPETDESTFESPGSLLLTLPSEVRNKIYFLVLDDIPKRGKWDYESRISGFCLVQPALAKANRQLRKEILPMFYHRKRSFIMRIHPKEHSEVDDVWNSFLSRLSALTFRRDGVSLLSYIRSLKVEIWHPASKVASPRRKNGCHLCNGILLHFGGSRRLLPYVRAGGDEINWMDRDSVGTALLAGIHQSLRGFNPQSFHECMEMYPLEMYPIEQVVDLVMMIAAECKDAAQVIRVGTGLAVRDYYVQMGRVCLLRGPQVCASIRS